MKLRFHDNSMRLRLSQSDVAQLDETGMVENRITFSPDQSLVFSITSCPVPEVAATFSENRLDVLVPRLLAKNWIETDQTGIEAVTPSLRIQIEKDFQCSHRMRVEDADGFPNPLVATASEPSSPAKPRQK